MCYQNNWLVPEASEENQSAIVFADVTPSWYSRPISIGDDQGSHGACAIFTFAEWAELMRGAKITDAECIALYQMTLEKLRKPSDSGLTFKEAYDACAGAGWLPDTNGIFRTNDLRRLEDQPLLVGVRTTDALRNVADNGCLDHEASRVVTGYHAMLLLRCGEIKQVDPTKKWVVLKNHWTSNWGYKGLCICTSGLFRKLVREIWMVV